jgi:hypothetical protein
MQLTSKHKIYGAIVGIGLAWLGYDQISAGPQAAGANEADTLLVAPSSAKPQAAVVVQTASPGASVSEAGIADRLQEVAQAHPFNFEATRDAFTPAEAWVAARPAVGQADANADEFVKKHRLMSVMVVGRTATAQIDGKLLRLGEEIDGFKLVSITKESVILYGDGVRAELRFIEPSNKSETAQPQ